MSGDGTPPGPSRLEASYRIGAHVPLPSPGARAKPSFCPSLHDRWASDGPGWDRMAIGNQSCGRRLESQTWQWAQAEAAAQTWNKASGCMEWTCIAWVWVGANHILPPVTHDGQVGEAEASVPKATRIILLFLSYDAGSVHPPGGGGKQTRTHSFRNSFAAPPTASLKENPPTTRPTCPNMEESSGNKKKKR